MSSWERAETGQVMLQLDHAGTVVSVHDPCFQISEHNGLEELTKSAPFILQMKKNEIQRSYVPRLIQIVGGGTQTRIWSLGFFVLLSTFIKPLPLFSDIWTMVFGDLEKRCIIITENR